MPRPPRARAALTRLQGYFSGTYNAIAGRIRHGSTDTGEVSGKWSSVMDYKSVKVRLRPALLL